MDITTFNLHIQALCVLYNGSVISGVRSRQRNTILGGHLYSLHLVGLASDVVFDTKRYRSLALRRARHMGLHHKLKGDLTAHFQPFPPLPTLGDENGDT